jgi:hypothetical protein
MSKLWLNPIEQKDPNLIQLLLVGSLLVYSWTKPHTPMEPFYSTLDLYWQYPNLLCIVPSGIKTYWKFYKDEWGQPVATSLQPLVAPRPAPRSGCPSLFFQRIGSRRLFGSEIFNLKKKKKNSALVSKRVHPCFRTLTMGFLSEDLVSSPQRWVFFLGTSF